MESHTFSGFAGGSPYSFQIYTESSQCTFSLTQALVNSTLAVQSENQNVAETLTYQSVACGSMELASRDKCRLHIKSSAFRLRGVCDVNRNRLMISKVGITHQRNPLEVPTHTPDYAVIATSGSNWMMVRHDPISMQRF